MIVKLVFYSFFEELMAVTEEGDPVMTIAE